MSERRCSDHVLFVGKPHEVVGSVLKKVYSRVPFTTILIQYLNTELQIPDKISC